MSEKPVQYVADVQAGEPFRVGLRRKRFWLIHVRGPNFDEVTQAQFGREEIDTMVQDLITLVTETAGPHVVRYRFRKWLDVDA